MSDRALIFLFPRDLFPDFLVPELQEQATRKFQEI